MGAWGFHFDENDDAADWLAAFDDSPSWSVVNDALKIATESEYLEAPEASSALAALEVVAAANGKASARLPQAVATWAAANAFDRTVADNRAAQVVAAVRDGSELAELWDEGDEGAAWRATVDDLANRLI